MNPLILIIVLIIVLVVIGMAVALHFSNEKEKQLRKMSIIQGKSLDDLRKAQEKKDANTQRAEIASKLKQEKNGGKEGEKKTTIDDLILQSGLEISQRHFWIGSVLLCVALVAVAYLLRLSPFVIGMVGVIGFFGLPRMMLKSIAKKRQKEFLEDFADGLEAMVRLLKAGMPVAEAVAMISKEYGGPLGEEMSRIYDQQKIGIPLHEAALQATKRMPIPEMNMFATGMAIQAQTGASLSDVLMNLAGVIRARFRLKRKVKALASEAVASAGIIGALPIIVASGMWFINPEYIGVLFTEGQHLLWIAIGMMATGIFVMRQMINFKV